MKIKKDWEMILFMPLMIPVCLFGLLTKGSIASSVLMVLSIVVGFFEYLRQNKIHNNLYQAINKSMPMIFKNELKPTSDNEVWAYYELNGVDIGVKMAIGSDYTNQSLNPNTLNQDIENYKIHIRGTTIKSSP